MIRWSLPLRHIAFGALAACAPTLLSAPVASAQTTARPARPAQPMTSTVLTPALLREVEAQLAAFDSLGALNTLETALARDRKNGPLWNRYARIAWGMSKTAKGPVMKPEIIRLRQRADSAFRYAIAFAPESAQYHIDLGQYSRETDNAFMRAGAKGRFEDGLKLATSQSRPELASQLADQLGMIEWSDYDNVAHRAVEKTPDEVSSLNQPLSRGIGAPMSVSGDGPGAPPVTTATADQVFRGDYAAFFRERYSAVTPPTGAAAHERALTRFREALALDPTNASARRHVYMAMADRRQWDDLLFEANARLRTAPDDIDALLARGLAATSLETFDAAATDFARALQLMSPAQRAAYTNIRRVLAPWSIGDSARAVDSLQWAKLSSDERHRRETLFWNLADPRASTAVNEAKMEFFARVAYADFRFGSEEYRIRGADSNRGDAWVRYGAPDMIYSLPRMGYTDINWVYDKQKLGFTFRMRTGFGTAYNAFEDTSVDSIHAEHAVSFDAMPLVRRTWPMRARVSRFRWNRDSVDAVITATVPVRSFLDKAELAGRLPITVQVDVHDPAARIVGREVARTTVSHDSLPVGINGAWVRRLGRGPNVVRVDAEQADVKRAATARVPTLAEPDTGFGISDLLLGTNPQRVGNKDPVRWRDVSIAPTTGVFPWAQPLGVVWEVYDLATENNAVRYKVHLKLGRTFASNLTGFVARVAAYTQNLIVRDGSGTGSVEVSYEQTRPAASVITDFLSVNLRGSVAGTYRLTIEIEDLISKKITRRTTLFELTPD